MSRLTVLPATLTVSDVQGYLRPNAVRFQTVVLRPRLLLAGDVTIVPGIVP